MPPGGRRNGLYWKTFSIETLCGKKVFFADSSQTGFRCIENGAIFREFDEKLELFFSPSCIWSVKTVFSDLIKRICTGIESSAQNRLLGFMFSLFFNVDKFKKNLLAFLVANAIVNGCLVPGYFIRRAMLGHIFSCICGPFRARGRKPLSRKGPTT